MQGIVIATLIVGVIGLLIGAALVAAGKKFYVEVDEREALVRECLPGNNCGGCGQAGCDAAAAAIVNGEAEVNVCPVCNEKAIQEISAIMGVAGVQTVKKRAFVRCAGTCEKTSVKCNYVGIRDCRSAVLSGLSVWECDYGCLGFGSCVEACAFDAIHVKDGAAVVDPDKCTGCGRCASVCPKNLIELIRSDAKAAVACSSKARGPEVKKACSAGCIGCKLCTKQCEVEAIQVENNLAGIDYDKCVGCEKCMEKCPAKAIVRPARTSRT